MFCQKCGNKLEENARFCSKCGTRQPTVGTAEQVIDTVVVSAEKKTDETVQPIKTATEACELLQKNAVLCPEVKSFVIEEYRSAAVVVGTINKYSVRVLNGQIGLNTFPVFPFMIPVGLCIFSLVLFIVAMDSEVLVLFDGVFMLLSGLSGIAVSVFGNKEKKIILPFIRKVLGQPKYIEQFPHIEMITYSMFVFSSIGFLVLFGSFF